MAADGDGRALVVALDDIEEIAVAGVRWRALRRTIGLTGFGTNAYAADAGEQVIEAHEETDTGDQEMYVVLRGAARFTLGDEERELAAGEVAAYPDPATRRGAVATRDGTLVLAVGGRAGSHPPSTWEPRFAAEGPAARGDWDAAAALVRGVLEEHPDDARAHFDLARFLARGGDEDAAVRHLVRAHELLPETVGWAAGEDDLAAVRDRATDAPGVDR